MLGLFLPGTLPPQVQPQAFSGFVEGKFAVRNGTIRYLRRGQGPSIILLHGFPEDHSAFRNVAPLLAKRFTVVVPDLRGIGGSTSRASRYDPTALSDDVRDLVVGLRLGQTYLVGHDFGAPAAYAYARRFPKAARGVMLIEGPLVGMPVWTKILNDPRDWHIAFHQQPRLPEALIAGREAVYFREHFLGPKLPQTDVQRYARAYSTPSQLVAALGIYRAIPAQGVFNRAHRSRFVVPIVVVGGEKGLGKLNPEMASGLRGWGCARVSTVLVKGAGHYLADEKPAELANLIGRSASR